MGSWALYIEVLIIKAEKFLMLQFLNKSTTSAGHHTLEGCTSPWESVKIYHNGSRDEGFYLQDQLVKLRLLSLKKRKKILSQYT